MLKKCKVAHPNLLIMGEVIGCLASRHTNPPKLGAAGRAGRWPELPSVCFQQGQGQSFWGGLPAQHSQAGLGFCFMSTGNLELIFKPDQNCIFWGTSKIQPSTAYSCLEGSSAGCRNITECKCRPHRWVTTSARGAEDRKELTMVI